MAFSTLTVDMLVSIAKFEKDLKQAVDASKKSASQIEGAFKGVKGVLGAVGVGLGVRALISSFDEVKQSILDIGKASEKTGIATEALSGLKLAAQSVEIPFENLVAGLLKFEKAIDTGNPVLQRLGFNLDEIARLSKDPLVALQAVADKFAAMKGSVGKAAIAQEFSKSFAELIPLLNMGTKGLRDFDSQAQRMGLVVTPEQLARTKELDDRFDELSATAAGFSKQLVDELTPALTELAKELLKITEDGSVVKTIVTAIGDVFKVIAVLGVNVKYVFNQMGKEIAATALIMKSFIELDFDEVQALADDMRAQSEKARKDVDELSERILHPPKPPPLEVAKNLRDPPKALVDPSNQIGAAKARLAALINLEKENASEVLVVLEDLHSRGLISEKSFYENRTEITRRELGNELKAVRASIAEVDKALQGADQTKAGAAQAQKIALLGQAAVLQKKIDFEANRADIEQAKQQDALHDKITEFKAAELEQQGKLVEAAKLRFDVENKLVAAQFKTNLPGGNTEVEKAKATVLLKAKLAELQQEQNLLLEDQATAEQKINNELTASGNTPEAQVTALERLNALRRASIGPLTESAEKIEVVAKALTNPEVVAAQERLKASVGGTAASLTDAAQAAERFGIAQQKVSLLLQAESLDEQHVQNLRTSGAVTSLEAVRDTDAVRRKSLDALRAQADALDSIQGKDEATIQKVRALRVEIEGLEASSHQLADTFNKVFEDAASSPFADFITGAKSAKEAFADFGKQVEQSLARIATQQLAEQIFGGGGTGGGIGGIIAGLFGAYAGGGGGGGGGAQYAGHMATGGAFTVSGGSGDNNLVAFHASRGERVTVAKPGSKGGGGYDVGGVTIVINNPRDAEDIRRSGTQIAKDVGRKINRELARS